jgi:branched-chain amino acid transport system ATP-binding protein
MTTILRVANLTKRFGGLVAVSDASFEVAAGEILGLLGPNGAGKTTLFNTVAGLYQPTAGRIEFLGRDISRSKPHRRAELGLARTFQITQPFAELTVEENVMVGTLARCNRIATARERAQQYIGFVGLEAKRSTLGKQLSTGQRKRLELARALATEPKLLLMDEVTGGVDQSAIPGLIDLVVRLKREGMTIVIIEHNMRVISQLADRLMFLDNGRTIVTGAPAEVVGHPTVQSLYLGRKHA